MLRRAKYLPGRDSLIPRFPSIALIPACRTKKLHIRKAARDAANALDLVRRCFHLSLRSPLDTVRKGPLCVKLESLAFGIQGAHDESRLSVLSLKRVQSKVVSTEK